MKYKIEMCKDYKKVFTIEEIEKIRMHSKEDDLQESIQFMIDILCGSCGELLKYSLTWEISRANPTDTYFGDGIEIAINAWIFDKYENNVRHTYAAFYDICQICSDEERKKCGYVQNYRMK